MHPFTLTIPTWQVGGRFRHGVTVYDSALETRAMPHSGGDEVFQNTRAAAIFAIAADLAIGDSLLRRTVRDALEDDEEAFDLAYFITHLYTHCGEFMDMPGYMQQKPYRAVLERNFEAYNDCEYQVADPINVGPEVLPELLQEVAFEVCGVKPLHTGLMPDPETSIHALSTHGV